MALRSWKRKREQPTPEVGGPGAGRAAAGSDPGSSTLSLLGGPGDLADDARAAHYREWADRLRERPVLPGQDGAPASTAGYWSPEALFESSRQVAREEVLTGTGPAVVRDLLAVLDLREGATATQIGGAYRRLAKQHHPDRFVSADQTTQLLHAAEMRRVIDAYHGLRRVAGR